MINLWDEYCDRAEKHHAKQFEAALCDIALHWPDPLTVCYYMYTVKSLMQCLKMYGEPRCEHLSHRFEHLHEDGEQCPAELEILDAMERTRPPLRSFLQTKEGA